MGDSAPLSSRILFLGTDGQARRVVGEFAKSNGYSVVQAVDGRDAASIMRSAEGPRIAIIDAEGLGSGGDGIAEAMALAKGDFSPYLILMTAQGGEAEASELAGPGPKALLCKPFRPDDLHHRLEVGRHIDQLQRKLRKAKAEVAELAMTDILTKVPNQKAILERLKAEMLRVSREDAELYVGLFDIDRFKAINEAYGTAIGDCVLVECVTRAVSVLRPYDAIGRLGGGRFLVIVPVKEGSDPFPVFERIRRAVDRQSVQEGELSVPATVSIGVARWEQWNGVDDLVAKAEAALSRAKASGRDRVEIGD